MISMISVNPTMKVVICIIYTKLYNNYYIFKGIASYKATKGFASAEILLTKKILKDINFGEG